MANETVVAPRRRAPYPRGLSHLAAVRPDSVEGLRRTRPAWERRYARWLPVVDLSLLLTAALAIGLLGRVSGTAAAMSVGAVPAAGFCAVWLLALGVGGAYESRILGQGSDEYKRLVTSSWHLGALLAVGCYALRVDSVRGLLFAQLPLGIVAMLGGRQLVRRRVWARRRFGFALHRVVVVGPPVVAAEVIREISRDDTGFAVVGVCTSGLLFDGIREDIGFIGDFENVLETVARSGADTVAVVGSADMPTGFIRRLAWQLEGTGVDLMVSPAITDVAGPRIHVRPVANLSLLYVEAPQFSGATRVLKNTCDRLAALFLLLLASPLLLLVAAAVKASSPGPVLYRQTRLGCGGRQFKIWKFRTMYVGADSVDLTHRNESDGNLFKIKQDPRITGVGRYLRRFSIDELPQLFNVLAGQMSLVGPRPLPVDLDGFAPNERRRLLVKPGMTGLWQVNGRSDLDWEESVRLDLYYVENWSLATDFVILLRTVAVVLRGQGAY